MLDNIPRKLEGLDSGLKITCSVSLVWIEQIGSGRSTFERTIQGQIEQRISFLCIKAHRNRRVIYIDCRLSYSCSS